MIAVASIFIIILTVLTIVRIATVALTSTGLPFEVARFQARSAITGVGFTTTESETIINHPLRRRIVMTLMLVGNAGLISIVASLMLSFVTTEGSTGDILIRMGFTALGVGLIGLFTRSAIFERRFTHLVAKLVDRFSDLDLRDFHHLLQLSRDYAVTEIFVRRDEWLAGRTLHELELPDEGVLVLAVQRVDGSFVGAPRGNTAIHANDTVILYGRAKVLSDLESRPATPRGDVAHREAVATQQEIMAGETGEDSEE